jgi:hypothetical protein
MRTAGGSRPLSAFFGGRPSWRFPVRQNISRIENVSFTQQLIHELNRGTLDNDKLDQEVIDRLRNPIAEPVDILDSDIRLSVDLYMSCRAVALGA